MNNKRIEQKSAWQSTNIADVESMWDASNSNDKGIVGRAD